MPAWQIPDGIARFSFHLGWQLSMSDIFFDYRLLLDLPSLDDQSSMNGLSPAVPTAIYVVPILVQHCVIFVECAPGMVG